jgi:REP element-mobilizing transposase RayT
MNDPIAYFLTWNTYGTWLPGDSRGWVEYHHGWQLPDPILELECAARMTEDACRLSVEQRAAVESQIVETCRHRGWHLHAVNCRSNHIHVVVSAPGVKPRKIRIDLKAWATRCLKSRFDSSRENWWAERGSIRHVDNEDSLQAAILYTTDAQDRKTSITRRVGEGPHKRGRSPDTPR